MAVQSLRRLRILGTRGIPAAHGGFETFAQHLALFLVARGWAVTVYCQEDGKGPIFEDEWRGIKLIRVPVANTGPVGTIQFDWRCTLHAASSRDPCLVLGYNTAVFSAWLRYRRVPTVINMDGIEWSRAKWGRLAKTWLYFNEWAGVRIGSHLVADHPEIKAHLARRTAPENITMIPYGAEDIRAAAVEPLAALGLEPGRFATVVARPEPENSILQIVRAFSARRRSFTLAVLGRYDPASYPYHRAVMDAASDEVRFLGAIYDPEVLHALRFHGALYIHGHQVGGTNPSLVEALGAGSPVLAHDNRFNRWVAGPGARYFSSVAQCEQELDRILGSPELRAQMSAASRQRFEEAFRWPDVLHQYETLLERFLPRRRSGEPAMAPGEPRVGSDPGV